MTSCRSICILIRIMFLDFIHTSKYEDEKKKKKHSVRFPHRLTTIKIDIDVNEMFIFGIGKFCGARAL